MLKTRDEKNTPQEIGSLSMLGRSGFKMDLCWYCQHWSQYNEREREGQLLVRLVFLVKRF